MGEDLGHFGDDEPTPRVALRFTSDDYATPFLREVLAAGRKALETLQRGTEPYDHLVPLVRLGIAAEEAINRLRIVCAETEDRSRLQTEAAEKGRR